MYVCVHIYVYPHAWPHASIIHHDAYTEEKRHNSHTKFNGYTCVYTRHPDVTIQPHYNMFK